MNSSTWKFEKAEDGRCINIDWLEVYCIEDDRLYPCNADFFRAQLFRVEEREYGTRQYREMFTLLDSNDQRFIEIRRNPVASEAGGGGIFDPQSCHIRLSNRYCYHPQAVSVLTDFLHKYGYTIKHIYRLDICLDFVRFDKGDDPHRFLERYLQGRYSKINQGNISSHGKDRWEGRVWNSVSWGSPTSMVSTKMYCKTLELMEAKDKPYIRYAWQCAGLVDNWQTLTKKMEDGTEKTQMVWRVEFSIRSKARHWLIIEDCNGRKTKRIAKYHDLGCYTTKHDLLQAFAMLAHHYFHFKKYQEGVRKDRCEDKVLFLFNLDHKPYVLDRLMGETPKDKAANSLLKRLQEYKLTHPGKEENEACDVLIRAIEQYNIRHDMPDFYDNAEVRLLQMLISERIKQNPKEPLQQTLDKMQAFFDIQDNLF